MKLGIHSATGVEPVTIQLRSVGITDEIEISNDPTLIRLLEGDLDMYITDLHDLPVKMPEGLVIAALSARKTPDFSLLIPHEQLAPGKVLGIPPEAVIITSIETAVQQLWNFRRDIKWEVRDPGDLVDLFRWRGFCLLVPNFMVRHEPWVPQSWKITPIDPREITPTPGLGALAFVIHEQHKSLRLKLKKLHYAATAELTNIERTVAGRWQAGPQKKLLGVHCRKDLNGFFHLTIAYESEGNEQLKRINVSSSTTYGLVDSALENMVI